MTKEYWIKFERDPRPIRFSFTSFEEFRHYIERYVIERGMIEWMIGA